MKPSKRRYYALQKRIVGLKVKKDIIVKRICQLEYEAKAMLPVCSSCKGRGQVVYFYDEISGHDAYGQCSDCRGYGRQGPGVLP